MSEMRPVEKALRERWEGLGPWQLRCDTPWGEKVVHADFGEAFIGTNFHTTKPTEQWAASAHESARARRDVMNKVAWAVSHAPDDIAFLLSEVDRLRAALGAEFVEVGQAFVGPAARGIGTYEVAALVDKEPVYVLRHLDASGRSEVGDAGAHDATRDEVGQ